MDFTSLYVRSLSICSSTDPSFASLSAHSFPSILQRAEIHCRTRDSVFLTTCAFFQKLHFPLTEFRSINKTLHQQIIVRKCRPRLHWIARKGLLLSVVSFEFEMSHSAIQTAEQMQNKQADSQQLLWVRLLWVRRQKSVVEGSLRPFLSFLP